MIISKTPFRVSFVGGGTDLKEFYLENPGAVLSVSINKYIYLSLHKYFYSGKSLIKYSSTEEVSNHSEIKHKIIREVFKLFSITDVDFNSTADIPGGTGMGSSSAFTAGLIKLCSSYKGIDLTNFEIAEIASEIEIEKLKEPIGKQDQFACSMGGLNLIKFNSDNSVEVKPLYLTSTDNAYLEENLILFYTGDLRSASSILDDQKSNTINNKKVKSNLLVMSQMAENLYNDLLNKQFDLLGEYLNEGWNLKKELSNAISNNRLNDIYNIAITNGAIGGKLLGAGGGGFFLFYVKKENRLKLTLALSFLKELKFKFDFTGTSIVFKNL